MRAFTSFFFRSKSRLPTSGNNTCSNITSFYFYAISHFSSNPKPKSIFPYSSNPTHARFQQLLLQKSKTGFDKLDDALVLFDKMLFIKPLLTVINFNQLLVALVKMQEHSVAVSLFRDMCLKTIPLDIFTFSTAINYFCHLNCLHYAFSLLVGIIKRGFETNVVTYTTIIRGLIPRIALRRLNIYLQLSSDIKLFNPMLLCIPLLLMDSAREVILLWLLHCLGIWTRKVASLIQ